MPGWLEEQTGYARSTALHSPLKVRFGLGQTEPGTQAHQLLGDHIGFIANLFSVVDADSTWGPQKWLTAQYLPCGSISYKAVDMPAYLF